VGFEPATLRMQGAELIVIMITVVIGGDTGIVIESIVTIYYFVLFFKSIMLC